MLTKTQSAPTMKLFSIVFLVALLGCATTQQGQQGDDQSNGQGSNNTANFENGANNGGNTANNATGKGKKAQGNNQFANSNTGGEAVNNASDDDFSNKDTANFSSGNGAQNAALSGQGQGNSTKNNYGMNMNSGGNGLDNNLAANEQTAKMNGGEGVNNALPQEEEFASGGGNPAGTPAMNAPVTDNAVTDIVDQAATPPDGVVGTNNIPAQPSQATYTPGGVVKYVRTGGASLYGQPAMGTILGQLEQGDHPLVFQENDWARTHDGFYIPLSNLSEQGVPRPRKPQVWR